MTMLTGNQIEKARLMTLRAAMSLEARGMKMSKGRSAMAITKKQFGWHGNRETIMAKLTEVIDAMPDTP